METETPTTCPGCRINPASQYKRWHTFHICGTCFADKSADELAAAIGVTR